MQLKLLPNINSPADIRGFTMNELEKLVDENHEKYRNSTTIMELQMVCSQRLLGRFLLLHFYYLLLEICRLRYVLNENF